MTAPSWPTAGGRVRVQPGQWRLSPQTPGHETHTIEIVDIQGSDDPRWAWVRGHGVSCSWPSADCVAAWCYEILVDVDVLTAAAAPEPGPFGGSGR